MDPWVSPPGIVAPSEDEEPVPQIYRVASKKRRPSKDSSRVRRRSSEAVRLTQGQRISSSVARPQPTGRPNAPMTKTTTTRQERSLVTDLPDTGPRPSAPAVRTRSREHVETPPPPYRSPPSSEAYIQAQADAYRQAQARAQAPAPAGHPQGPWSYTHVHGTGKTRPQPQAQAQRYGAHQRHHGHHGHQRQFHGWDGNPYKRHPPVRSRASIARFKQRQLDRMAGHLHMKIEALQEHRPLFLYWAMFVQVVVLVVLLSTLDLAPIAFQTTTDSSEVLLPSGIPAIATRNVSSNFYIGPALEDLVRLGAKFTPCMRLQVDRGRFNFTAEEATYGCCLSNGGDQCYTTIEENCTGLQDFNADRSCGSAVCCRVPSQFPECEKLESFPAETAAECQCEQVARPCCLGTLGDCRIITKDECDFRGGYFNPDATLCSQVDCMQDVCGLSDFKGKHHPDQWYRLFLALFLHVGVLQLIFMMIATLLIGIDLERMAGSWRVGAIYLCSGIGGYLTSSILTPFHIEVGASPALYGLLASLMVELIQSWKKVQSPCWELSKLLAIIIVSLCVGLFPYVDNFSHVGGFVFGLVSSVVFLPSRTFSAWHRARKRLLAVIFGLVLIVMFGFMFYIFTTDADFECEWCHTVNCVNFVEGLCDQEATVLI